MRQPDATGPIEPALNLTHEAKQKKKKRMEFNIKVEQIFGTKA
jgi:hypothetical protein